MSPFGYGDAGSDAGAWIAGIDEAGLGPILGPLSIGYTVFRVPERRANPWTLLRKVVTRDAARAGRKLVVADSKKVFTRNEPGKKRLERTVLSFLALLDADGGTPRDPAELVRGAVRPEAPWLEGAPWYASLPALPCDHAPETIELEAALLEREMRRVDCSLVDAGVRVVPAAELNASYRETDNKSDTVWTKVLEVLRHVWTTHGARHPQVTVDMLGGRTHYGGNLARGFQDASVRMIREGGDTCTYELTERDGRSSDSRQMRLVFCTKGDQKHFAVALASCLAKYARELVMDSFNTYFGGLQPDLRPTAGYHSDGSRWIRDAEPAVARSGVERTVLIRER